MSEIDAQKTDQNDDIVFQNSLKDIKKIIQDMEQLTIIKIRKNSN